MKKAWLWIQENPFLAALLIVVVVVSPGYAVIQRQAESQQDLIECMSAWADAQTDRATALTEANVERTEALDRLVRSVVDFDDELFRARLGDYIEASDTYQEFIDMNPPPEPPRTRC